MVCWLRFLKLVSDLIADAEPSVSKRKSLAIAILKDLEKEEGHNVQAIGSKIEQEGKEGLLKRARRKKKGRGEQAEAEIEEGCEVVEETAQET